MTEKTEIVVFYSWQSDLPKSTNLQAIRTAVRTASSAVEGDLSDRNLLIRPDEATRNVPGSRNIPDEIRRKILASDIFVCDVTPICKASDGHPKSSANPNVIFELGYAVAQLGWDRVILLFNKAFGDFPKDLPFDFDRHRASPYTLPEASAPKKTAYAPLVTLLTEAIATIIKHDPKKPSEVLLLTPEQTRRQRDIKNLMWLLANIHWPTLEQHIEEAPKIMGGKVLYFYEVFNSVLNAKLFHLYDTQLLTHIDAIHRAWNQTTSHGRRYERVLGTDQYIFSVPPNRPWTKEEQKSWAAIEKGVVDLDKAMKSFLDYVRTSYLEIDLDDLNRTAWKEYVQSHESFRKSVLGDEDDDPSS
jgi:hypothetical protein